MAAEKPTKTTINCQAARGTTLLFRRSDHGFPEGRPFGFPILGREEIDPVIEVQLEFSPAKAFGKKTLDVADVADIYCRVGVQPMERHDHADLFLGQNFDRGLLDDGGKRFLHLVFGRHSLDRGVGKFFYMFLIEFPREAAVEFFRLRHELVFANSVVRVDGHGGLTGRTLHVDDIVEEPDTVMVTEQVVRRSTLFASGGLFARQFTNDLSQLRQFCLNADEHLPGFAQPRFRFGKPPLHRRWVDQPVRRRSEPI